MLKHIPKALAPLLILAVFGVLFSANVCGAGDYPSWWGSSAWWDWSDYRGGVGIRGFLARLTSGSIEEGNLSRDLRTDFGMISDPDPFGEFWGELYIDRLGLRLRVEEDNTFQGRVGTGPETDVIRSSELETSSGSFGVDLDLIRYPFLRLGIDYDVYFGKIKLLDRTHPYQWTVFEVAGRQPMTIGVHGLAIPTRIRGVPVTVQARARFPVPLLTSGSDAKVTEWEVSAGLRPAIWDTSIYAHSTFSVGLSGGFRWVNLETDLVATDLVTGGERNAKLKARWQGAFIELGLAF